MIREHGKGECKVKGEKCKVKNSPFSRPPRRARHSEKALWRGGERV
jgi:hypothetical protein